jgi:hypothetical protein
LSTGSAADLTDTAPAYVAFQPGLAGTLTSPAPADWLAANGGAIPTAPGCPAIAGAGVAYDPIVLELQIRVPTNVKSFGVGAYFFGADYPEYVCSQFNDSFVVLLDSTWASTPPNPADRNLAFVDPAPLGAPFFPVGVNLALGNTGLFRQCVNGLVACGTSQQTTVSGCLGVGELAGTGFELPDTGSTCGAGVLTGGGTGWLTVRGNVVGGEVITVRFGLWDNGDAVLDSLVLLDNWRWFTTPDTPGTGP